MKENNNVVNEIQRAKEETIQEVTRVILNGRENLNLDQIKNEILIRVENILKDNNFFRHKDSIISIVNDEVEPVLNKMDNSFDRKGNCLVSTLDNELSSVQKGYTLDKEYDMSQGLNETLNKTLNNYDYEKQDTKASIEREMQNRGFDSHRSIVYEKVKNELKDLGIYDEEYVNDIIVQVDTRVKNDLEKTYDSYLLIDNNLARQIEDICVSDIRNLNSKLQLKKSKDDELSKNNSNFLSELKESTNSSEDIAKSDIVYPDRHEKIKNNEKEELSLPLNIIE